MAVPGWPLPAFWTASAASMRTVSTARTSRSVHPARVATGADSDVSRILLVAPWSTSVVVWSVTVGAYLDSEGLSCRVRSPGVITERRYASPAQWTLSHRWASGPHRIPKDGRDCSGAAF